MARLWAKARSEMAPGSWLISNSFAIPGMAPDARCELGEGRQTDIGSFLNPDDRESFAKALTGALATAKQRI